MTDIIGQKSYRAILEKQIAANAGRRGYQKQLAEAAACHTSFLSQVRHANVHLSLDQGANLARFWQLSDHETEYFLALISLERAASPQLKLFLQRKLRTLASEHLRLSRRLTPAQSLGPEDQVVYYSTWYWSALHVLSGVPALATTEAMARHLQLTPEFVGRCLERLAAMGLVRSEGNAWAVTSRSVHLTGDSPLNAVHHANWRQRTISRLPLAAELELSYTGIYALSRADYLALREVCIDVIKRSRDIVGPSTEEMGCTFLVDLQPL